MKATSAIPIISAAAVAAVLTGVAHRVPARELPGRAPDPTRREADQRGDGPNEPRREHRDADEQEQDAPRETDQAVGRAQVVG